MGALRKVYWLCGSERVLVEESVDLLRRLIYPADMDYMALDAGAVPEREVWAAINQFPMDTNAVRMVLIRRAEKLQQWDRFMLWADDLRTTQTYVVFVSSDSEFPLHPESGELADHMKLIKEKGKPIRCARLSEKDMTEYVRSQIRITDPGMLVLLQRTECDSLSVVNFLRKVNLFDSYVTDKTVKALCAESVTQSFASSLIARNKPKAYRAAELSSRSDINKILGLLELKLNQLGVLSRGFRQHRSISSMVREDQLPVYAVEELKPLVKDYPLDKIKSCMAVIRLVDELASQGVDEDVLTTLVALW